MKNRTSLFLLLIVLSLMMWNCSDALWFTESHMSEQHEGFTLDAGRPITVGVNHTIPSTVNNADKTTDHFVVIYGRGDDEGKQQYYYNYIETGRSKSKSSDAYKEEWKFYYNPEDKSFIGDSYRTDKENYSIVQIRPNI